MATAIVPNTPVPQVQVRVGSTSDTPKVVASRALEAEDEFRPYYTDDKIGAGMSLIEPPYNPAQLQGLCSENNSLGPCIDAMETNIDGTGYVIEKDGEHDPDDPSIKAVEEFFDEVYPGLSFEALRRSIRRDLEQTGNGYMEVMRNVEGRITFLRHVPSRTVRILRLDAPVLTEKTLIRQGKPVSIPTIVRERRYAQMLGPTFIYFREFGSSRHVNCRTGWWDSVETPVAIGDRGTEVIHFKVNDHYYTPYGLPRWEGQIPSVLGSRRAEEHNLTYFDTGGLPPALITVTGGAIAEDSAKALDTQFNDRSRNKHRVAIMDVQATGGSLDASGNVKIDVHTFGQDREKDGLFQVYDKNCHDRVRRSFRLPPLFVGEVDKMNFAVAYTAYLTAENQVFRPERDEFDRTINTLLMGEIAGDGFTFRSKDMSIADISTKLAALQVAAGTGYVDPKDMIKVVNEVAGLDLQPTDKPVPMPGEGDPTINDNGNPSTKPATNVTVGKVKPANANGKQTPGDGKQAVKSDLDVLALADQMMIAMRQRNLQLMSTLVRQSDGLNSDQQAKLRTALAVRQYLDPGFDPEGMGELAGCTAMALIQSGALD